MLKLIAATLVLATAVPAAAQMPKPAASAPPTRVLQPAEMRDDLQRLEFTLQRAQGNPYRYLPEREVEALFRRTAESLRKPMTDLDFYRRLAPLVDSLHDSHTSIALPPDLGRYFSSNARTAFPLDLRYVDGRALVEADLSDSPAVPAGSEVVSIHGQAMEEVTREATAGISADGMNMGNKLGRLNRAFWYYYSIAYGPAERYRIVFRDRANGRMFERTLPGIPPRRLADRENGGPPPATQRVEFPGESVAVLTLDELSNPGTGEFLKQAFHRIAQNRVSDLIIDLRKCPGGEDAYNNQLFSFFSDRPFRFYLGREFRARSYDDLRYVDYDLSDFITPEQAQRLPADMRADPIHSLTLPELLRFMLSVDEADGVFLPAKADRFTGRVYLLVSGNSSSSAAEIAALMHHLGLGTIIGEEPNGDYQGLTAGAIPVMTLPHSKLRIRIPLISYHNAVMPGLFKGRGAPPAFPVAQTLSDAVAGRDTVMTFARDLIRRRRAEADLPTAPTAPDGRPDSPIAPAARSGGGLK